MTSADHKPLRAPGKAKRILPRGGKWPAAPANDRATPAAVQPAIEVKAKPAKRRPNPTGSLWGKAQAAARAAQLLCDAGDWDGATNRAYYAVFNAARAALAGVRASHARSKQHGTIVRRFEKHIIEARGVDPSLGQPLFSRLSHARWVADYSEIGNDELVARKMLAEAERFLAAVEPFMKKAKP